MNKLQLSRDAKVLLVFSLLTLVLRLITLMEVSPGGDNIDYWYYSKALVEGYPYGDLFHRNIRWAMILPVSLFQLIFGTDAWVICLIPLVMSILLNYSIYLVGREFFSKKAVYFSIILVQIFPYMIRVGSQLFLALFSMNYLLLAIYFLIRERRSLILSLIFMFLAYETKITNIYFLLPILFLLYKREGLKSVIIYGAILFGLYLVEHTAYLFYTGNFLGRLGIITSTHFGSSAMTLGEGVEFDGTFLGLFERFAFKNFPIYWHLITWPSFIGGVLLFRRAKYQRGVLWLIIITISFFFIQTFAVKSVSPFVPMEDFIVRYFMPVLPFISLLFCQSVLEFIPATNRFNEVVLYALPVSGFLLLGICLDYLPGGAREYLNNPLKPSEHQLIKTINFQKEINELSEEGYNFYYTDGDRRHSHRALDSVNRLYLDLEENGGAYNRVKRLMSDGTEMDYLDVNDSDKYIEVLREPFELLKTGE